MGANSFLLEYTIFFRNVYPFSEVAWYAEMQTGSNRNKNNPTRTPNNNYNNNNNNNKKKQKKKQTKNSPL